MQQILRQRPSKYDRIARLNKQIQRIEETLYPDNYDEIKETMLKALADRIDDIVEDRI